MTNTTPDEKVKSKANSLRMPFAQWLAHMAESSVPYQARALAVYAVVFKATSNEELARLVGMDTKGAADKTYNKWKRELLEKGWVIVSQITVGRKTTVDIAPAYKCTLVTFTDVAPRQARKFYDPYSVTMTDMPVVKVTDEPKERSPYNPLKENNYIQLPSQITAASESEKGQVIVNCSAIRGPNFALDFGAIDLAAGLYGIPKERARQIAELMARDWVANGKVPDHPMGLIKRHFATDKNQGQIDQVRVDKATQPRSKFASEKRSDTIDNAPTGHAQWAEKLRKIMEGGTP